MLTMPPRLAASLKASDNYIKQKYCSNNHIFIV